VDEGVECRVGGTRREGRGRTDPDLMLPGLEMVEEALQMVDQHLALAEVGGLEERRTGEGSQGCHGHGRQCAQMHCPSCIATTHKSALAGGEGVGSTPIWL
jgi:hypothetical protein